MSGPKYRIYIDEVGNSDLESSDNPNHRFLSLTGVAVRLEYIASVLQPELESLKRTYFGHHPDEPIIFHRKEMLHGKPPFDCLSDKGIRERFDRELLERLAAWDYSVITVCLDKKRLKETYTTWRYDPYHYCLAMLLERYCLFLSRIGQKGDAMAESRGGKEDRRLKNSYERLFKEGTQFVEVSMFRETLTSKELKVKPKAINIAGLQLADLLAHPSRNEVLKEHDLLTGKQDLFGQKICAILARKYDHVEGRVYGKKFI